METRVTDVVAMYRAPRDAASAAGERICECAVLAALSVIR